MQHEKKQVLLQLLQDQAANTYSLKEILSQLDEHYSERTVRRWLREFVGLGLVQKLDEETIMILNHKEAIRYLVENIEKIVLNENTIYALCA